MKYCSFARRDPGRSAPADTDLDTPGPATFTAKLAILARASHFWRAKRMQTRAAIGRDSSARGDRK